MASQNFRAGVVIVVRHPGHGQILAFERSDARGSWQLPQGGLDADEDPLEAAWRELEEETGLHAEHVEVRAEFPEWVAYEWPDDVQADDRNRHPGRGGGQRRGQVQKWFLFDAKSPDVTPTPDGSEFVAWRWVDPEWLVEHVVEWRRDAYRKVLASL
jgi:putative (di)nucleoside polyphosphate hydrolase